MSPKAQATRLPVTGLRTDGDTQYVFHDLPGLLDPAYLMQARMRELALDALERMDLVLHLHPAPDAPAPPLRQLAGLDDAARGARSSPSTPRATSSRPPGGPSSSRSALVVSADDRGGHRRPCSRGSATTCPSGEFEFDPDDVGTQPLRFFVVEYLREAAFELLEDELPYGFTAEVEEFREAERPVYIRVTLFVERESQKGIVIGRGGRTIKAIGAHARAPAGGADRRARLSRLLGQGAAPLAQEPAALTRFGFPEPRGDPMTLAPELLRDPGLPQVQG